jgi:hypothetical protein
MFGLRKKGPARCSRIATAAGSWPPIPVFRSSERDRARTLGAVCQCGEDHDREFGTRRVRSDPLDAKTSHAGECEFASVTDAACSGAS